MSDLSGSITISGLAEIEARLKVLGERVEKEVVKEALKAAARLMQDKAISNVKDSDGPHWLGKGEKRVLILPGNLRKGIKVKFDRKSGKGSVRYEVFVKNKDRWYWKFVEFGTVKMSPRKYMRNAFESEKENAVALFKSALLEAIGRR